MAITQPISERNAFLDWLTARIDVNPPGKFLIYTSGFTTLLCTINLANDSFAAAVVGVATANGLPRAGTAVANGEIAVYRCTDGNNQTKHEGTVTLSGGGGDAIVDNLNITSGQTVTLLSWTLTSPP